MRRDIMRSKEEAREHVSQVIEVAVKKAVEDGELTQAEVDAVVSGGQSNSGWGFFGTSGEL